MDNATDYTPPPSPRRRWQFSLRELLLLTAIAGLLLTVWRMASDEFEPTSFQSTFKEDWAVRVALGETSGKLAFTGSSSHLVSHRTSANEVARKHVVTYQFRNGGAPPSALLSDLKEHLKATLTDAGCQIIGDGVSRNDATFPVPHLAFFINYRQGKTCGLVTVDCVSHRDVDVLEVYFLIHEFLDR